MIINFSNLGGGGGTGTIPTATTTTLGGVIVGTGLSVTSAGVLSADGTGSENVVELTQAQYDALTAYTPNTTYIITDAVPVDLNEYAKMTDLQTLSGEVITKAAKQNITAYTGTSYSASVQRLPRWNAEGVITGSDTVNWGGGSTKVNGSTHNILSRNASTFTIFAPTVVGNSGDVLQSGGSGAPSWKTPAQANLVSSTGGLTIWRGTSIEYDAIVTKDANTMYIIVDE